MGEKIFPQRLEMLGLHRLIIVPPDRILRDRVADNELVARRTARVRAGFNAERPGAGEFAFGPLDRLRNQLFG